MGGIYDGRCRHRQVDLAKPYAIRLKLYDIPHRPQTEWVTFEDLIQGQQPQNLRTQAGGPYGVFSPFARGFRAAGT